MKINKKRNLLYRGLFVPADHRVKIEETRKRNKYFNLARELKKLWNMKVIPAVIGVLEVVPKG